MTPNHSLKKRSPFFGSTSPVWWRRGFGPIYDYQLVVCFVCSVVAGLVRDYPHLWEKTRPRPNDASFLEKVSYILVGLDYSSLVLR